MAGTSYRLTCTVAPPRGVQFDDSVPPDIQWPGLRLTPTGPSWINSGAYVSTVTLNPLHSGTYICSASYCLSGICSEVVTDGLSLITNETTMTIMISELTYVSLNCITHFHLIQHFLPQKYQ